MNPAPVANPLNRRTRIKICGLTREQDVDAAVAAAGDLPAGSLDPDAIHLPGIYVHRVVPLTAEQAQRKSIEKRTTRVPAQDGRTS